MKNENYGPSMTAKQKKALEAEIAAFDANKAKRVRATIEREATSKPDVDAYQEHLDSHSESVQANPDLLSEENVIPFGRATADPQVKKAIEELTEVLSHRQMQVWRLCMRDGLSETEAADRLRISQQNVSKYLKSAKQKIEKHFKKGNNL